MRIILKFLEKYKYSGIAFFLQSSRYVSNEQSCLKTTGLYDDHLLLSNMFHFFYFIFIAPISFMFSNFPIFFFAVLFQAFINCCKAYTYIYIYIYIYMYNIYIRKHQFLPKKIMTF